MTTDLRPYPDYKDSGLPWLGRIPAHWGIRASKRMFSQSGERARHDDEQLSATKAYGVILQSDFEERVGRKVVRIINHLEKRRHVEPDDFVISMRSFQGDLERAFVRGAIRSSYVVLKPGDSVHVPYFGQIIVDYVSERIPTSRSGSPIRSLPSPTNGRGKHAHVQATLRARVAG